MAEGLPKLAIDSRPQRQGREKPEHPTQLGTLQLQKPRDKEGLGESPREGLTHGAKA